MKGQVNVFPACAGVIPDVTDTIGLRLSFPRMRGGDPGVSMQEARRLVFSPHARG